MNAASVESPAKSLEPRLHILARFKVMLITVGVWSTLSLLVAFRTGEISGLPYAQIAVFWISTVAGPFAFLDSCGLPLLKQLAWAAVCLALALSHPIWRNDWATFPSIFGISLWFFLGLALSTISV
jgi:hypothetical protein